MHGNQMPDVTLGAFGGSQGARDNWVGQNMPANYGVRYSDATAEQAGQWRDEALVDAEAARLRGDDPGEFERRAALWASEAEKAAAS